MAVYAITTRESDGDVFHFNQYVNFADDAAEQEYLDEVAKRAFYTTGDYARADERLLTLCTCTYEMSDARLLIMARPLRMKLPSIRTRCFQPAGRLGRKIFI